MNILVIGDIHEPFALDGYLEFCKDVKKRFKTTHTVFIGDGMDAHASSYHENDADGMGAGTELEEAIKSLSKWHKAFPKADYIMGNHCAIIERKMNTAKLPRKWMRPLKEVLNLPTWNFHTELVIDDVLYIHGQGVTARTMAQRAGRSVVQGHRHTEGYVWHNSTNWGMQVGTGIDSSAYAFAYAKHHPDPILSCGVVLDDGAFPLVVPFK